MKKQRRRRVVTDWLLALQQSRNARSLRENAQSSSIPDIEHSAVHTLTNFPSVAQTEYVDNGQDKTMAEHTGNDQILDGCTNPEVVSVECDSQDQEYCDLSQERDDFEECQDSFGNISDVAAESPQPCAGHHTTSQVPGNGLDTLEAHIPVDSVDYDFLLKRRRLWENKRTLSALVAVVGSVRYTVEQYEYTRNTLKDEIPDDPDLWPPYSRMQRCFKDIVRHCMPRSSVLKLPKASQATQVDASHDEIEEMEIVNNTRPESQELRQDTEQVRIFFPSSWAQVDVATSTMFSNMLLTHQSETRALDSSQIALDRTAITETSRLLFADYDGESIPCFPKAIITVSAQRNDQMHRSAGEINQRQGDFSFDAIVLSTWCVASSALTSPSSAPRDTIAPSAITKHEQQIMRYLSKGASRPIDDHHVLNTILPGDICTLLRRGRAVENDEESLVIVHRFWRFQVGMPSMLLLKVAATHDDARESLTFNQDDENRISEAHVVTELSLRRQGQEPIRSVDSSTCGTLEDGTPFIQYRMLLYCDDFQKSSFSSSGGSAGGCYIMPLSYPPEERRSTSSVRLISLTPPGVSTNEVLKAITDDIVRGSVHGVDGFTTDGTKVRIFLDLTGFIGDYPAASSVIDVIGHVGNAPCTLCAFKRLNQSEANGSRYGYTTAVHANSTSFLRSADRHVSLRQSNISDTDANLLGMVRKQRYQETGSPLLIMSEKLNQQRHLVPLTSNGKAASPASLDPYRCNLIAPDHLLTGLTKDILNTVFLSLPTKEMKLQADIMICAALRQNGLLRQKEVFNIKKNSIHSMTLSEIYCVLLVAVPSFRILTCRHPPEHSVHEPVKLLRKLQRLIALTYWWPQTRLDGDAASDFLYTNRKSYFSELKRLSKEYVRDVDKFCVTSELGKARLDKPNLHRIVELYEHSIPIFGHVREFMELVFESAHQPLKRSIQNSNNHDAHIFAMEQCVGNDWQGRVAALHRESKHEDESRQHRGRRGLRRLFLGSKADLLDAEEDNDFASRTDEILARLFTPALQKHFQRDSLVSNFERRTAPVWKATKKASVNTLSRIISIPSSTLLEIVESATRLIEAVFPEVTDEEVDAQRMSIALYTTCKRVKVTEDGRQIGGVNGFNQLSPNCVLQVYLSPTRKKDKILRYQERDDTQPTFFIFIAALHRKEDYTWAICLRCSAQHGTLRAMCEPNKDSFQILCLTDEVRRIATYHVCQDQHNSMECVLDLRSKSITHSQIPIAGSRMYFQRRVNGYPPRVA